MLNMFIIKRWVSTLQASFIPLITFAICVMFYSYWIALGASFAAVIVSFFIHKILITNPFTDMIEGKGLLCFNFDSTGVIKPFLLGLNQPYVKGKLEDDTIQDVYDRETVLQLAVAAKDCGNVKHEDGKIKIELDDGEFNRSRFGLWQYPVLVYNAQIKSLITKDFLSEQEKLSFAEHGVLYLNRKLEELTSITRDFARYVVELTKPQGSFYERHKWLIWVAVIGLVILLLLFAKPILQQIMGAAEVVTAKTGASGGAAVSPR